MLYFIGLGLGDVKDITVRGLEIVKKCDRVYLEGYTSILTCGQKELEDFYGRELILADREMVEQGAEQILDGAEVQDVAFLVVGDPFGATTHSDMVIRAKERNIPTKAIHNASIMNAIGCTGLQLYLFGETVSIPYWTDSWEPESFYDKIAANYERGMHTLCLLDIKVKEQTVENLIKGNKIYEPPRFMSTCEAVQQILKICEKRESEGKKCLINSDSKGIGVARVGSDDQKLAFGSLNVLASHDLGRPLHSLVIPGKLHPMEIESVESYAVNIS